MTSTFMDLDQWSFMFVTWCQRTWGHIPYL